MKTGLQNTASSFVSIDDKIEAPRSAAGKIIPRPRLSLLSPDGLQHRGVTTLVAPAGYGKSTLLSQWKDELDAKKILNAWFQFDQADNDPASFLEAWIACLKKLDSVLERSAPRLPLGRLDADLSAVAQALLADLRQRDEIVYLLLDDAHEVTSLPTRRLLAEFIRSAPTNVKFVIASRTPPTVVATFSQTPQSHRIFDAKALAFNLAETTKLIEICNHLRLSAELAESVRRQTEGCAAVLRLVSLALEQEQAMEEFESKLANRNRDATEVIRYADYTKTSRQEPKDPSPKLKEALEHIMEKVKTRIAQAKGETTRSPASTTSPVALIEALTRRELEILNALHSDLDCPAVAKSLFISMHTLKWHLKNIYSKLGVGNRTGAVVKGQVLGLID